MNTLDSLKEAISGRIPISFRYLREGKNQGPREGHPHAVYIKRLKSGEEKVYADIVQTAGVSDSNEPFPSFRKFLLNDLADVKTHADEPPFGVDPNYNPTFYEFPIAKV